jgi:hypothetical protein
MAAHVPKRSFKEWMMGSSAEKKVAEIGTCAGTKIVCLYGFLRRKWIKRQFRICISIIIKDYMIVGALVGK